MTNNKQHLIFKFNQAIMSAGKSYSRLLEIAESKTKHLIIVPSKALCDEHAATLETFDSSISIKRIHTDTSTDATSSTLIDELATTDSKVVITTKATFERALHRGLSNLNQYELTIDEAITTHKAHYFTFFKASFEHLKNYIDFIPFTSDHYAIKVKASLTKKQILQGIISAKSSHADALMCNDKMREFLNFVLSASHTTTVHKDVIDNFDAINHVLEKATTLFVACSVLNADVFAEFQNVMILSSRFTETESYAALEAQGVEFVDINPGAAMTNDRDNVFIHYAIDKKYTAAMRDDNDNSKKWTNSVGLNIQHYFVEYAYSFIRDEKHLFCCNESDEHLMSKNGVLINTPHGLNNHKDKRFAIHIQSVNAHPFEIEALKQRLNITRDIVDFDRNVLNCSQFCARTAIRDKEYQGAVHLFVIDKQRADDLKKTYTNATVIKADIPQITAILEQNNKQRKQRTTKDNTIPKSARDCKSNFEKDWLNLEKRKKITQKRINTYIEKMQQYYSDSELVININTKSD